MIDAELNSVFLPFPQKGDRKVWIYVPTHGKGVYLPVIYMADGQNLFDEDSTPCGCWGVIEAVEAEQKNGFDGAIIVGIDNGNEYRDNELTPKSIGRVVCPGEMPCYTCSQGEMFDDFLMNTVIPYVEENYPVKKGRAFTAVCGSSSGGLQAFFEGMEHSDKFAYVGAFSPAFLLYTEEDWRNYLTTKISDNLPYLYIYSGCGDSTEHRIFESVDIVYDLLSEAGYPFNMINEVVLFENCHNEKAWKEIFPDFLRLVIYTELK